ncbi:CHASE2 domain-containing protein [Caenimonas koreensis]|uniref:CHASE2 domain-containing protein n=1 Tax=Caenimonas koreensis TaxID=367474 RepID=UPI003783295F
MLIRPPNPGKQALKFAGLSALLGWVLGLVLSTVPAWQIVELKVFDLFTVADPPKQSLPITIIGIDEASFTQLDKRWPWPRDMHAQLIDKLAKAGAAVIAFDVLFPESASPKEDEAFAASIKAAGNVVLAADFAYHETASIRQWMRVDPTPELTKAGATTALASIPLDDDSVIRQVPDAEDAFWRQVIKTLIRVRPNMVQEPYVAPGSLMRHLGPPRRTFPHISYYQVLNGDPSIPPDYFANQIVLIGKDLRVSGENNASQGDLFSTPFLYKLHELTPGVELHATLIENALMGQTIRQASIRFNTMVLTLVMLLSLSWLAFWGPLRSAILMIASAGAVVGLAAWQFQTGNFWFWSATPVVSMLAAFMCMAAASYWTEKRRANEIRGAFSKYVSQEVVDRMVAHPEELKLGGQRRELTVVFTDLAGFTSLSEKLTPEGVADVINLYLNEVTKVVMAHHGTVDKFVGDAVMAFWGAPLDDEEHALNATRAAIEMQVVMDRLQPRFEALGAGGVSMRVGLNSGPAIVGNMGSDLRFDYTALGDTVNLAARLEGANKAYGTGILLSSSTAELLRGRIGLRRVDKVKVKGKNVPVEVFTPCDDASLAAATERAWHAYQNKHWDAALQEWEAMRASQPGDSLAQCYVERIGKLVEQPPEGEWDGAVSLDKL